MLSPGQTIGTYQIGRKLGEGGMGAVFEATHTQIGRKAAIKVLHPQLAQSATVAIRFLNEAKAANLIDHPGVVEIFEFNRLPDGMTYIVMELLKGEPLAKRLERGPVGLDALRIGRQVGSVLIAAHGRGIVHRDLKPENIFMVRDAEALGGERAKVLDFGIAKIAEEQVLKTQAGSILGTPAYMAPEQCRGAAEVTPKSDVYAMGIIMYQMLSGKLPFTGQGVGEIMLGQISKQPPPLREVAPGVPVEVADLVHKMLAKDPGQRPSMTQFVEELERLATVLAGVVPPVSNSISDALSGRHAVLSTAPVRSMAAADAKTMMAVDGGAVAMGVAPPVGGGTGSGTGGGASAGPPRTIALGDEPPALAQPHGTAMLPGPTPSPGSATMMAEELRKRQLLLGGIGMAVLTMVVGISLLVMRKGDKKPPKGGRADMGAVADGGTKKPDRIKRPRPPKGTLPDGMVFVPGGKLALGSTKEDIDDALRLCEDKGVKCQRGLYEREQPQHEVKIGDFYVDQTEVTNGQLVAWLNTDKTLKVQKKRFVYADQTLLVDAFETWSGVVAPQAKGEGFSVKAGMADKPAVLLTWETARRFCEAAGKRLPSEAEWELAARGLDGNVFPWGNEPPRCDQTVFGRSPELPADRQCAGKTRGPANVGTALQDRTPDHVLDLGGNVSEMVLDVFADKYPDCGDSCDDPVNNPPQSDPQAAAPAKPGKSSKRSKKKKGAPRAAEPAQPLRVVRGGNFDLPADACRGAGRSRIAPSQVSINIGFRCVQPLKK